MILNIGDLVKNESELRPYYNGIYLVAEIIPSPRPAIKMIPLDTRKESIFFFLDMICKDNAWRKLNKRK
jgi:hypothetical protein